MVRDAVDTAIKLYATAWDRCGRGGESAKARGRSFHFHGTGGQPGPWHRLAHCAETDLPKHLRERQRACGLSYELVEASDPRVITAPPLVPRK